MAEKKLSKKALNKSFRNWAYGNLTCFSQEHMQTFGYLCAMLPLVEELYDTKEEQKEAMNTYTAFFNTEPQVGSIIVGITAGLEEAKANGNEDIDAEAINGIRAGLMGPLAGIRDSFIWRTLRIIATGVGLSLANQGNILGLILFLLIFNLPAQGLRYYLMNAGYKLGSGFLAKIQQNGLMSKLTYAASVLGLMVVGGMTAENVSISFPLKFGSGHEATTLNSVFNNIMPGLMPLLFTLLVYYLLKKKNVKTTTLLLICVVIGLVGAFFGILGC